MNERLGTLKSHIQAPRWAAFPSFLKNACFALDLKIVHIEIEKGFIRETVRFKVEGFESNLMKLKRAIQEGVDEYNT